MSIGKVKNIGIICPAKASFNYCNKIFSFDRTDSIKGRNIAYSEGEKYNIYSIYTDTGKINSAAGTQLLIDEYNPQLIIDTGMSFSLSDNVEFYTVVFGEKGFEYDVFSTAKVDQIPKEYITSTLFNNEEVKDEIKNYLKNKKNSYEGIIFGNIASAEKEVDSRIFRGLLRSRFNTSAWSNNTSAILKVAEINEVKSISLKVVLSTLKVGTGEKITGNQKQGCTKLYTILNGLIDDGIIEKIYELN